MYVFRSLLPYERQQFTQHLLRLSPADRRMRFGCAASDGYIQRYVGGIAAGDPIYVAFDDALVVRGAAHVAFNDGTADLGLSVEDGLRGQGLGTRLLQGALDLSQARGAHHFTSQCLTHNRWMMAHVKRLGFRVTSQDGESTATAELPAPTPVLLGQLALSENLSWLAFGLQALAARLPRLVWPPALHHEKSPA
jgi:RimJ/RimL family protein N-acetyltransferase